MVFGLVSGEWRAANGEEANGESGRANGEEANGESGRANGEEANGEPERANGEEANGESGRANGEEANGESGRANGEEANGESGRRMGKRANGESGRANGEEALRGSKGPAGAGGFPLRPTVHRRDLNDAVLDNRSLARRCPLAGLYHRGCTRRAVDYRNLGPEELGSVYESCRACTCCSTPTPAPSA